MGEHEGTGPAIRKQVGDRAIWPRKCNTGVDEVKKSINKETLKGNEWCFRKSEGRAYWKQERTRSDREDSSGIEQRDEMNISKVSGADRLQK
jgi:hypothetical protein